MMSPIAGVRLAAAESVGRVLLCQRILLEFIIKKIVACNSCLMYVYKVHILFFNGLKK